MSQNVFLCLRFVLIPVLALKKRKGGREQGRGKKGKIPRDAAGLAHGGVVDVVQQPRGNHCHVIKAWVKSGGSSPGVAGIVTFHSLSLPSRGT